MLHYLLLGYIGLYVFVGIAAVFQSALGLPNLGEKNEKPWETPAEGVLGILVLGFGLAGMLFLSVSFQPYWLRLIWRPISIGVAIAQVWSLLRDWEKIGQEPTVQAQKEVLPFAYLIAFLLEGPAVVLNLYYAFR
ncbi:MAG: hypothetical protein C5B50_17380 [Verrucomicrobia bacterium]|nr:MAG: hypothetical protein C5B50_17380 [Verrucomicrobiota bacterium]